MTLSGKSINASKFELGQRRGKYFNAADVVKKTGYKASENIVIPIEKLDLIYRSLCGILYNFAPQSGHPGGSISSGRIVESLIYNTMDYDFSTPDTKDADYLCYAAGHKALGLYAMWALRNECVRIAQPNLLPGEKQQIRLEDLLGFRRNPTNKTPLYKKFNSKPLDGHPTPATPFVRFTTGASGFGVTTAVGMAFGALDTYGADSPYIHIIEGEGGMTPGRVSEAMAAAASSQIKNIVLHIDWNQASIDSNHVCREGSRPGDYVQWNPAELAYLHDWNVISVADGFDYDQIFAAQQLAVEKIKTNQPTAIVYRTTKGWKYGIEGRASHGAGHEFCSPEFYNCLAEFEKEFGESFPRFNGDKTAENIEQNFYDYLMVIRKVLERNNGIAKALCEQVNRANQRLKNRNRTPRAEAPNLSVLYDDKSLTPDKTPEELVIKPGQKVTSRGVLGNILNYLTKKTKGAIIGASADLTDSTNLSNIDKGMQAGYYNYESNPNSRLLQVGGICEDAIGGVMAGASAYGNHVGVGCSYGAFIAALTHVSARLYCIGQQARSHTFGDKYNPLIIICAHAGYKTGEDGPTHADPQPLQLFEGNFPKGTMITLTPWDTQEMWPLVIESLRKRPAVIAPFVTRPTEVVVDRKKAGLPPLSAAIKGVYALRIANPNADRYHGTIVLQGSGVGNAFVNDVLPKIQEKGLNLNVYYVTSAELFDLLPEDEQEKIFPASHARQAMGITEFTLPTMYRWVVSAQGRKRTLHAFAKGHYMGSGQADKVFAEAGLDGESQLAAILDYAKFIEAKGSVLQT